MKPEDLARWRMHNLCLSGTSLGTAGEVVGWLGAVQAQDYGPAKWSIGQRLSGADDAALDRAFAKGTLLRTHVLRPTWHFVLPVDIRWLLELTGPRVHAANGHRYRQLGLDEATRARSDALLANALSGGTHLTRAELSTELAHAGIAIDGQRLPHLLMHAELGGVICSGPLRGKQHTYALLAERAPQAKSLPREQALAELVRRYFTSHGPATIKDLRWWSSLTLADIRQGLEMVADALHQETIDGLTYYFAEPSPAHADPSPTVHLVQGYDEYIVGYTESKYLLDVSAMVRSRSSTQGLFNHVVLLDGQVAGHWKRTPRRKEVTIEVALYTPFNRAQTRALHTAAQQYGQFLGLDVNVVTGSI